jgi:hypothetical protein
VITKLRQLHDLHAGRACLASHPGVSPTMSAQVMALPADNAMALPGVRHREPATTAPGHHLVDHPGGTSASSPRVEKVCRRSWGRRRAGVRPTGGRCPTVRHYAGQVPMDAGSDPGLGSANGCGAAMPTVRANEECGWTMRGREPCWTRSVADSISWAGRCLATTTTRSPSPASAMASGRHRQRRRCHRFRGSLHLQGGSDAVVDSGAGERLGQGGGAGTAWRGLSG